VSGAPAGLPPDRPVITDERILAAGTSLRFLLLLFLFVAGTYSIATDVAAYIADGNRNDATGCLLAAGADLDLGGVGVVSALGNKAAYEACLHHYVRDTSWVAPSATAAMILVSAVVYLLLPRWKARRSRYLPLARLDAARDLQDVLDSLVFRSYLPVKLTIDDCCVDLGAPSVGAVVFGTRRHPRIRLNLGLLRVRDQDPERFEAVMLHELAHVANRDVGITFATIATWRVFLLGVLLPGAAFYVKAILVDHTPASWGDRTLSESRLVLEALIVVLAYLTRADILRTREIYADRTAQTNNARLERQRQGQPVETATLGTWRKAAVRLFQPWRTHPPWPVRNAALRDPSVLFRPGLQGLFITGFAADIATHALVSASSNNVGALSNNVGASSDNWAEALGSLSTASWSSVSSVPQCGGPSPPPLSAGRRCPPVGSSACGRGSAWLPPRWYATDSSTADGFRSTLRQPFWSRPSSVPSRYGQRNMRSCE
jgi:Zn-dependent protease with chaperone function